MTKNVYLLGVDPGLANMGWCVVCLSEAGDEVVDAGVFRTQKSDKKRTVLASDDNMRRAQEMAEAMSGLFQSRSISVICAESMSFPRNSAAAAKMAMCWGALAAYATHYKVSVTQASPQEVKKTLCAKKDASKEEVEQAVLRRYPGMAKLVGAIPRSYQEHAYDSAAAAITAVEKSEVIRALRSLVR